MTEQFDPRSYRQDRGQHPARLGEPFADELLGADDKNKSPEAVQSLRLITVDDEPLALKRLQILLSQIGDIDHVGTAPGCAAALDLILRTRPDVMLLDVCMRDGSGFELIERLPDYLLPQIIFVTGFDNYATSAFDVHAVDYLLKPVELGRLKLALDRARRSLDASRSVDRIQELRQVATSLRDELQRRHPERYEQEFWIRRQGGGYIRIAAHDIDSVVADDDYVKIRTGGREHLMRETVKGLFSRLDPQSFVRIHRSAVVRTGAVKEFRRTPSGGLEAQMRDGAILPVGRVYAKSLRKVIAAT